MNTVTPYVKEDYVSSCPRSLPDTFKEAESRSNSKVFEATPILYCNRLSSPMCRSIVDGLGSRNSRAVSIAYCQPEGEGRVQVQI